MIVRRSLQPGGSAVLKDGQVVTVTIEAIGSCRNEFYAEPSAPERY
jgi:2-keto-4-pentenoate hydratase/2-oxohepta-3-ene-1,7-dioic acid hydratase in catechol pathway